MARVFISVLTLLASALVVAPAEAQAAETYEDIVADTTLTTEHAIVVRFYQAVFAREPDPAGLRFWLDQYDTGEWSTRRIANFFATSDEFLARYGETDNQAFMTAVYSNVLGRQPDAAGGAFWKDQLDDGLSRAEMILLISNAPEFIDPNLILADNEAEAGIRFDFGQVERVEVVAGVTWIWFDRHSFGPDMLEGVDHTQEPRYEMASDFHGGGNLNERQRRFPLAPDAAVLVLDPVVFAEVCGGIANVPAEFVDGDLEEFPGEFRSRLASLTFNSEGHVTLVRDQRGC